MYDEYKIKQPKYFKGQNVKFRNHSNNYRNGKIVFVETHYSNKNVAYHIYSILGEGNTRAFNMGEDNILFVMSD